MSSEEISLRPVTEADDDLLFLIYASSRVQEMAIVPWTPEQKEAFLRMQFRAQKQHYAAEHPRAHHDLILSGNRPVGRLYLDRQAHTLHILDITLLPEYRGRGIGSQVLGGIMDEARRAGKEVTIHVEVFNPSLRLFERLGFEKKEEKGVHLLLRRAPASV